MAVAVPIRLARRTEKVGAIDDVITAPANAVF
jgi:hypothetical protein